MDIFPGISAFNGMLGTAKSLKDINDTVVRNQASIDLQGQIIAAQQAYAALLETVRELKEKVTSLETWEAEKQRYELKDLGWGAYGYMLRPAERGITPPHVACANCYAQRRISIIQNTMIVGQGHKAVCPSCKTQISPNYKRFNYELPEWLDD